jgi:segregation and condensation protein B
VTSAEQPDSLAEQAAAWVPPWARTEQPAAESVVPQAESAVPQAERSAQPPSSEVEQPTRPAVLPAETRSERAPAPEPEVASVESTAAAAGPAMPAAADPEPAAALALLDDAELRSALEAILLVVDEPVAEVVLAQVLEQPTDRVGTVLRQISESYTAAGHGFDLRRVAGGWRLYTRPEYAPYVERFVLDGQSVRLTQAALETLAVVAYKQPVTRGRISAIRGVNCDGVVRTLSSRGLIEECGSEPETGAYLYRTSTLFLEKLGLNSVEELPSLAPFLPDDVEEIPDAQR